MKSILAATLALTMFPAAAQVYKCVDARGVTHYSDKPQPGCKGGPVDIRGSPPISGESAPAAPATLAERCAAIKREYDQVQAAGMDNVTREEKLAPLRDVLRGCP